MPTQRAIPPGSINEYQQKLQEVNGHTTRCNSPLALVLRLRLVSGRGLQETDISDALWAHKAREELYCLTLTLCYCNVYVLIVTCSIRLYQDCPKSFSLCSSLKSYTFENLMKIIRRPKQLNIRYG